MTQHTKQQGFFALFKELVILLVIVFLIRTFIFGLYQVPTGSMETTMLVGERFFADKFTYRFREPRNQEVISFNDPTYTYSKNPLKLWWQEYMWGPANWTKRVIGTPGQTVKGILEDGKPEVYVDGKKLDEPYLNKYPLIRVYPESLQALKKKFIKKDEHLVLEGRVSRSQLISHVKEQIRCSAHWKSYDPKKPFNDQPFYDINPKQVVRNQEGQPDLRGPDVPLEDPKIGQVRFPTFQDIQMGKRWNGTDEFEVTLGDNEFWVMGDNRKGSHDSRFFGPIKRRLIHGKIVFRIWSNDSDKGWWIFDLLLHPIKFWKQMRWSRFFQFVS